MFLRIAIVLICCCFCPLVAQTVGSSAGYVLSTDDGLSIHVVDLAELDSKALGTIRIDHQGNINLPLAGRIKAAGLTVESLELAIASCLVGIMNHPEVSVSVVEYRNHPVSVLGSVRSPGVYQVSGKKTLYEVLSLAGGLNPDAGNTLKITRNRDSGSLPLPDGSVAQSANFLVGELKIRDVLEAKDPKSNIEVLANDVVTVPRADLVYVVGAVRKSGGFPLSEKEQISVLQAISLAEGLDKVAGGGARILRQAQPGAERVEVPVDVKRILAGQSKDVALRANDILFVPTSAAKSISTRAIEAAVQAATGVIIFAR